MICATIGCLLGFAMADDALRTVAEASEFRATARYSEVVDLLKRIDEASPRARLTELGVSGEGRLLPALILADPPVTSPEAARATGKLIVLAIGNIHAGEVDGKEALPMLAREIIRAPDEPLLRDLIVVFAPIYNADGNERVSKDNRPGQVGPEEGMGQRANAAGLDLNRDFIKLAASETRGLVEFLNRWDPAIFIDTHTTNGSIHRYVLTWEGPKAPAGDATLIEFVRDRMLPDVQQTLRGQGYDTFVYGDFDRDHTRWETYPAQARYGTTYVGLRGRISVLSEGYSYAPYRDRVLATRAFVREILVYAARHRAQIAATLKAVDERASDGVGRPVALRTRAIAAPQRVIAAGVVEEQRDGRVISTGRPRDYSVELWTHFEPTLSVTRPWGYALPPDTNADVLANLRQHGLTVRRLNAAVSAEVEVYRIDRVQVAEQTFQQRRPTQVDASPRREQRELPPETFVVDCNHRLGNLTAYLLEPQSEDGLATWNFFDGSLSAGRDFPVLRVLSPLPDASLSP